MKEINPKELIKQMEKEGYKTELEILEWNEKDLEKLKTVRGTLYGKFYINEPSGFVCIEDFGAGETCRWAFFHDEFHYILEGEADLTYSMPPLHLEKKSAHVKAGQFYMIPAGAEIEWKVAPGSPYRKLCVGMPAYKIPYPGFRKIIG